MKPAALMLQGTGSDVGKSLLVAGLARAFTRRGLRVRPFKPQNMSNNAAVTPDGGEIGRAQALQARACGVQASVHMNPVLLKPQTDIGAQVVVQGKVWGNAKARDYGALKGELLLKVLESFAAVSRDADLILVEGAGSPAEVNLRAGDIANMGFAEAADLPVVLIGDIDRGGVIASIVGTWRLLPESERARLKGVIVNKFRGDVSLFDGGLEVIARETGLRCFGVVPYFAEARRLPAEDALGVERDAEPSTPPTLTRPLKGGEDAGAPHPISPSPLEGEGKGDPARSAGGGDASALNTNGTIHIAVPVVSRIANFDDFDPLIAEPDVRVSFVRAGQAIPGDCDLVILPGSKATLADLAFLRAQGWDIDIAAHLRRGGQVLGLCAGYQMLGTAVRDPRGIEGEAGAAPGLGLLEVETELADRKTLTEAVGVELACGESVNGYEMHMGRTEGPGGARPMLRLNGHDDGALSADGRVMGCYLHGLFAADGFRHAFLSRLKARAISGLAFEAEIEAVLDRLAEHLEMHLDLDALLAIARREAS
jgi:adenosylcobyric acid synthase